MHLDRSVQRSLSRAQGIIRKAVVEFLKREEPQSLRFVRVGISPQDDSTYKVSIKIYHAKPLRVESILEVVRIVQDLLRVEDWLISAPHAGAIRIEARISLDVIKSLLQAAGIVR